MPVLAYNIYLVFFLHKGIATHVFEMYVSDQEFLNIGNKIIKNITVPIRFSYEHVECLTLNFVPPRKKRVSNLRKL